MHSADKPEPKKKKTNDGIAPVKNDDQQISLATSTSSPIRTSSAISLSTVSKNPLANSSAISLPIQPTTTDVENTVCKVQFKVGEIVWARIKGFPAWPAKVIAFPSNKMALVTWFNDYRKTKLYRTQMFKFLLHFDEFAKRFGDSVGLETAAREALISYGQDIGANALY